METFVIRVWVPAEPEPQAPLRGLVEHVGTRWSAAFADGEELLDVIGAWVRQPSGSGIESTERGRS